jgi:hypothetical protein
MLVYEYLVENKILIEKSHGKVKQIENVIHSHTIKNERSGN